MANLETFLTGYRGRERQMQQERTAEIGQLGSLANLQKGMEERQQIEALKGVMTQAGGDPAKAIPALLQLGTQPAVALAEKLKGLMPKPAEPYNLGPNVQRRGPNDELLATGTTPEAKAAERWSLTYDLNGAKVQRNLDTGQVRQAVSREPQSDGGYPSTQFISTPEGIIAGDRRTGELRKATIAGKPIMKATDDPQHQGNIAAWKAAGKYTGEQGAKAETELPQVLDTATQQIAMIDQLVGNTDGSIKPHPGFKSYVGLTMKPFARLIDGTSEADFDGRLKQLLGGAFLQAFQALKGGGHITEIEGEKATQAITRMSKAQSEREFVVAARDLQTVIQQGVRRAQTKARFAPSAATPRLDLAAPTDAGGTLTPEEQDELDALRKRFGR